MGRCSSTFRRSRAGICCGRWTGSLPQRAVTSVSYLHRLLLVNWPGRDGRLSPARCHTVTNAILIYNGVKFNVNAICCHNMLDDKYCCFIVFISCVYAFVRMIVRQFFLMNKDSYIRRRHSRPLRLRASGLKRYEARGGVPINVTCNT